jgi:hypothetical protein
VRLDPVLAADVVVDLLRGGQVSFMHPSYATHAPFTPLRHPF